MAQPSYKRRNRILCLHGPTQSAASFRAALKPLCDAMARNWEFHFLDAPFIVHDPAAAASTNDDWTRAAICASQVVALDAELDNSTMEEAERTSLQQQRHQAWQALEASQIGQQVWQAQQDSGADGVESLISSKVPQSMSRDWTVAVEGPNNPAVGVQVGLAMVGDYMREQGTFHGIIGFESGATLALLIQSLLSHPRSSTQAFPTYFAELPKGMNRMPRMGGWEEEPPAPNDPRLGQENLPKRYVPAQKPLEALVMIHPQRQALGGRAAQWIEHKQPILRPAQGPDAFSNHSIAVHQGPDQQKSDGTEHVLQYDKEADTFDRTRIDYLTSFLQLAIESGQGDAEARRKLAQLPTSTTTYHAKL